MHKPEKNKYAYASITAAYKGLPNMKQKENKSLIDYLRRIKQTRDVLVAHVRTDLLGTYVENTTDYQAATTDIRRNEIRKECFNKWMAYLTLINADQTKYGTLLNTLSSLFSMKKDQYPANIANATDILKNHKHDDAESRKKSKSSKDDQDKDTKPKPEVEIPSNNSEAASSFVQNSLKEGYCYCCGKKGHLSPDCPDKDHIPKSEWAYKKATQHLCADTRTLPPRIQEVEEEDNVSAVSLWTSGLHRTTRSSQSFILARVREQSFVQITGVISATQEDQASQDKNDL